MRKSYTKPEILFEDFTVTANIATGCEAICNAQVNTCAYEMEFGGITLRVFGSNLPDVCLDGSQSAGDKLCYHVPEGYNTFSS